MSPKFLISLGVLFYLLERHTLDQIWIFCSVYSCLLALCAFLYHHDKRKHNSKKSKDMPAKT